MQPLDHESFLRRSFDVAKRAQAHGNHPFGAILEHDLKGITGSHAENPTLDLPCRVVFAAGQRPVEVIGPLLTEEAAALHVGVWDKR
jgi:hypothetical protein